VIILGRRFFYCSSLFMNSFDLASLELFTFNYQRPLAVFEASGIIRDRELYSYTDRSLPDALSTTNMASIILSGRQLLCEPPQLGN
jgi:hypothetical protein